MFTKSRGLGFVLFIFTVLLMGCEQGVAQPDMSENVQKQEQLSTEVYDASRRLLTTPGAVEEWESLPLEMRRKMWESLVKDIGYPTGSVSLIQVLEVNVNSAVTEGEIAWLPMEPTVVSAGDAESAVGPTLPENVRHLVDGGENENVSGAEIAFDLDAVYDIMPLEQQPVPLNAQTYYSPVAVYRPIEVDSNTIVYEYQRLLLLVFAKG